MRPLALLSYSLLLMQTTFGSELDLPLLIEPAELAKLLDDNDKPGIDQVEIVVIDLREYEAFKDSHIRGARHTPLAWPRIQTGKPLADRDLTVITNAIRELGLTSESNVVLYGDRLSHERVTDSWAVLRYAGVKEVSILEGGWERWSNEGHQDPIDNDKASDSSNSHQSSSFEIRPTPGTWDEIGEVISEVNVPTQVNLSLDEFWILFCTVLVFFLQAGFLCMEAGIAKSKHSIDSSLKNLFDLIVVGAVYWVVGYSLMYGNRENAILGDFSLAFFDEGPGPHFGTIFFLFQLMYCATAMTIASGAVAERMRFRPYVCLAILVGGVIYPMFGHLVWAGLDNADSGGEIGATGILSVYKFKDFAGATTVHLLGACVACVAAGTLGPRSELGQRSRRWDYKVGGHSVPLAALGLFIFWLGSFGFTAGRTFTPNERVPLILLNTMLAGIAGGAGGLGLPWLRKWIHGLTHRMSNWWCRKFSKTPIIAAPEQVVVSFENTMNGVIAGLVAICAGCNLLEPSQAVFVGIGASVAMFFGQWILHGKIDDVVGSIPAHGFAGAWGTIILGFLSDEVLVSMQIVGVGTCVMWTGCVTYLFLFIWLASPVPGDWSFVTPITRLAWENRKIRRLRLSRREERSGMNVTTYKTTTELHHYLLELFDITDADSYSDSIRSRETPQRIPGESQLNVQVRNNIIAAERIGKNAGKMLHDFKSHIRAMIEKASEIERNDDEALRVLGGSIRNDGYGALDFIRRMQDFWELAERADLNQVEVVSLIELIDKLVKERIDRGKRITFSKDHDLRISVVPELLEGVLRNYVDNAIEYARSSIDVDFELIGNELFIRVADDGPGISEEPIEKVFECFFTTRRGKNNPGTGVGLYIARESALRMGGEVLVSNRSSPTQGAIFEIKLPESVVESSPIDQRFAPPTRSEHRASNSNESQMRQIIIVDDHPAALAKFTNELSCEIQIETNQTGGLLRIIGEWWSGKEIDCVLLDKDLGSDSGVEIAQCLRSAGFPGIVIGITDGKYTREEIRIGGLDDWISKDVLSVEELAASTSGIISEPSNFDRDFSSTTMMLHSAYAWRQGQLMDLRQFVEAEVQDLVAKLQSATTTSELQEAIEHASLVFSNKGYFQFEQVFCQLRKKTDKGSISILVAEVEEMVNRLIATPNATVD